MEACNRHEKTCDELVQHTFPGGRYKASDSVFKQIKHLHHNLLNVKKDYRYKNFKPFVKHAKQYYPFQCVFDFEAMLQSIDENDNAETIDKKLKIIIEHVPVSVSILSNVPGYEDKPIFLCNSNPEQLINDFVNKFMKSP